MSRLRPPKPHFYARTVISYAFLLFPVLFQPTMLVIMDNGEMVADSRYNGKMAADCCYNGDLGPDEDNVP